jgi:translation initiation factor 3 subunit E
MYDPKLITKEKIRSVNRTNMTELVEDEYQRFADDAGLQAEYKVQKPLLAERMKKSFELIDHEPAEVKLVTNFFAQKDLISELIAKNSLTLENISAKYQITAEVLDAYYKFSKFKYECGMYKEVEEMLCNFLSIQQPAGTPSYVGALWGRLACQILLAKWGGTVSDLQAVKEAIDVRNASHINQLKQRAWLLHWGLFILLSHRDGAETLADLFAEKAYLQTVENLCPWLLRYYTAAVILSPSRRRSNLRDLLREIKAMSYQYSDPMTQFLDCLFDQFDFDEAQVKLKECQQLVKNDFFLQKFADRFMHEARMLICEMYCTINRSVDLAMLAEKLQLTAEEAERWMVDIVRGSTQGPTAEAKIDSAGCKVLMAVPERAAYKQVIDATRELTTRSAILGANLEGLVKDQAGYIKENLVR